MIKGIPEAVAAKIRIVTVDENELSRTGLALILSQEEAFEVVASVSTVTEAISIVQRQKPEILLFSIQEEGHGIESLHEILTASEETRVLALADCKDQELLRKAVRCGASGVFSKKNPAAKLVKAIECVHAGEAWLDRMTTATLLRELSPRAVKQDPEQRKMASLTEREREVIKLVGKGYKNKQIGEKLFISSITVHHHLTAIYSKLDVADRLELLIYAYRNNLAELPN